MKKVSKMFLNLLFNENETVCVSDCQGGYHSVAQELDNIVLISPTDGKDPRVINEDKVNLIAINPVSGFRRDKNVTAFRTFLMEFDDMSLAKQKEYVDSMDMPYSVCIFSGNKSLHYGIVLDKDLLSEQHWRITNQWILNIMKEADQACVNPTRSIRFPGNKRRDGKVQKLVEIKERVKKDDLLAWLNKHPQCKPKEEKKITKKKYNTVPATAKDIPKWIKEHLENGVNEERDNTWFRIACWFAKRQDIDTTEAFLENFFTEESDFKRSEFNKCIKSAYNTVD